MDHMRFGPLQSTFGKRLCEDYHMPCDLSTGILIDDSGAHRDSTAVLRILPHLGFPYTVLGRLGLWVPKVVRDWAYQTFARNRGAIWRFVKKITGMGDTQLEEYRDRILGLEEPLNPGWGFAAKSQADDRTFDQ